MLDLISSYRYKCVSKTDIKFGWLKNPKTLTIDTLRQIKTMEELFPSARPDYSYVIYYEAVYVM